MSGSPHADLGTIAHALAAMCMQEGKPAAAYIGRVIESSDYEHAKLSPSGAHRWMRCAGSYALERQQEFKPRTFSMPVTKEMAEGVQKHLDAVATRIKAYEEAGAAVTVLVEQEVPIDHLTGEEGATGTSDVVLLVEFPPSAEHPEGYAVVDVIDLKFGMGVEVFAEDNEQLRMYASGTVRKFAEILDYPVTRVCYGISQPRIREGIDEETLSIADLQKFEERVKERAFHARATLQEKPGALIHHLNPSEKACKFCDAKATCPKVAQLVAQVVLGADDFDNVSIKEARPQIVDMVDNERLAKLLSLVPIIDGWCKAVAAHAESEILSGRPVPGWKAVQGRKGARAWTDKDAAEAALKSFRLKHDEMYKYSVISPTDAEKVLKDSPKRWAKLADLITQTDGKPTIVPESDKRPALTITPVVDDFDEVTNVEDLV